MSADDYDKLIAEKIFPEPFALLRFARPPIESIRDNCDVVLDTNVLLFPYTTGTASLAGIRQLYERLQQERRLFIPAQVAREFAKRRASKIGDIISALSKKREALQSPANISYPLVSGFSEYTEVLKASGAAEAAIKAYRNALTALVDAVKSRGLNDPVAAIYAEVFSEESVRHHSVPDDEIITDLRRRYDHDIPPGYKDSTKDDGGIGDFQIWLTILAIGTSNRRPLVFVSGDEKPDWQYRTENQVFAPRYELIDEYRRASDGKGFYMLSFSNFLEIFKAPVEVVSEVRDQELHEFSSSADETIDCPNCQKRVTWRLGIATGSSAWPICNGCGERFHLHRTSTDLVIRKRGDRPGDTIASDDILLAGDLTEQTSEREIAECPGCGHVVTFWLGREVGSSAKPFCRSCGFSFHAHRLRDGAVLTRRPGGGQASYP